MIFGISKCLFWCALDCWYELPYLLNDYRLNDLVTVLLFTVLRQTKPFVKLTYPQLINPIKSGFFSTGISGFSFDLGSCSKCLYFDSVFDRCQ